MSQSLSITYQIFDNAGALPSEDEALLRAAEEAVVLAYAPYSGFSVGAALLLADGTVVRGSNQENASYPAGICAERVALSTASSLHPGVEIKAIAIAYSHTKQQKQGDLVLSPCGICRQSLLEKVRQQHAEFRVIMSSPGGKGIIVNQVADLLPFAFSGDHLH